MTREEAKAFKWFQSDRIAIYKHIDKIYDDFENRSCANCIYNLDNYKCTNNESMVEWLEDIDIFDTFGCNKFIRKQQ